jgi:outer membrane protein assembly factor BamB
MAFKTKVLWSICSSFVIVVNACEYFQEEIWQTIRILIIMKVRSHFGVKINLFFIISLVTLAPITQVPARNSASLEETPSGDESQPNALAGELIQPGDRVYLPKIYNNYNTYQPGPSDGNWPMAGANPQRNSWTSEEVRGVLTAEWYKPFEPYIMQKVQIIAEYGLLYISTARGLYALDASTGEEVWVYPTELPLGHSPTIVDGVAYVGGFDHKLHAVDAFTGNPIWMFSAGAGFDTNPLVVDAMVYAGNRDGYFYAIYADGSQRGQLAWKYKTNGPIHYSAAYSDGTVYFASNDSRAYALDAVSGQLVWKTDILPGAGFHSWWPVVYGDVVIFSGSLNYRASASPGLGKVFHAQELADVYPAHEQDPKATLVGPLGKESGRWISGTPTIDTSRSTVTGNGITTPITEYFESKPWRRTYFVLNRSTGKEITYDFDHDGKPEFAPILWVGTYSGNRYPPVVGSDGVVYQGNNFKSDSSIAGGHISGWGIGTPFINIVNNDWNAVDEPIAYSAGGDLIYWNRCCDRIAGAFDITIPEVDALTKSRTTTAGEVGRKWHYFSYNLDEKIPGYAEMTYAWEEYSSPQGGVFGGVNGSYGFHGDVNAPIPYKGKVYIHRGNAIIAFSPGKDQAKKLPIEEIQDVDNAGIDPLSDDQIRNLLDEEVKKILSVGHLRPGYAGTGLLDLASVKICGSNLLDYWHNPADTIYTLLRALPHLSRDLEQETREYLENEFDSYPPYKYEHIGWQNGAAREAFLLPPEVLSAMNTIGPETRTFGFPGWEYSPFSFYALWKYAEEFGDAKTIFDLSKSNLAPIPPNDVLIEMPHVHNAFIAGYRGYLELQILAEGAESASIRNQLDSLLELRVSTFSKDAPDSYFEGNKKVYCRNFNSARNFMFLVPELAEYLRTNALDKVEDALREYDKVSPLWFLSRSETALAEGTLNQLYDYNSIFQAKGLIMKDTREELSKYLDIPAFPVGDLFYIQNLVTLLEAESILPDGLTLHMSNCDY